MSVLDSGRWPHVSRLLDDALGMTADAQSEWLEQLPASDAADVRRLLAHRSLAEASANVAPVFAGLLDAALVDTESAADDAVGFSVGAWTTRQRLGSGGMGTVYRAECKVDGVMRHGALKLLQPGVDSREMQERFRRERQILMRLTHPSIASLLDGGVSADGRPYLVMAHVEGVSLDEWAARADVDLGMRCELILQLCDAVAYAHRMLVVHRDIKPSNVMVDARNRAHLLDFGIAKVLEETGDPARTATDVRVFTRAYAAPEQAAGGVASTAVDVYQLGVLLFELCTGARFHDDPDATRGNPSQRLAQARLRRGANGPARVAARALRGDMGVIVARAVDDNPARRYASVEALADDLQCWRDGRPIRARADSQIYRLHKFARRHWFGIAASAAILLVVLAGAAAALWQARIARAQAQRAETVSAYLEAIFRSIDPSNARGREVSAKELIDAGVARIDTQLAAQPAAAAQLHATLGETYLALGDYAKAEVQLRRALDRFGPDQAAQSIHAQVNLAEVRKASGDLDGMQRLIEAADARRARVLPRDAALQALLLGERASVASNRGDAAGALELSTRRLEAVRQRLGAGAPETLDAAMNHALYLDEAGQSGQAVAAMQQVVAGRRKQLGPDAPELAVALHNLASFQANAGQSEAALTSHRAALRIRRKVLPANHPDIARSLGAEATLLSNMGRTQESMTLWPEVVAVLKAPAQPDRAQLAANLNNWGVACYAVADYVCAEQRIGEAFAIWRVDLPAAHPYVLTAQANLAALQLQRGDLTGGEKRLRALVAARLADIARLGTSADKQSGLESSRALLVQALRYQRRYADALVVARQADADAMAFFEPPNASRVDARGLLARSETEAGDFVQAAALARQAIAEAHALAADGSTHEAWAQMTLALALLGERRAAEALAPARRGVDQYARFSGANHWRTAEARGVLGLVLAASGHHLEARQELGFALRILEQDRPYMPIIDVMRRARIRLRG
ncbi:MAG TPA: protein kinase [Rhodanobacteraceae bacterium]|nr:protein kinase [Rhodanobacteraceae bacterium]